MHGCCWSGNSAGRLQAIERSARVRLEVLDAVTSLGDLELPDFGWRSSRVTGRGSTAFESMTNTGICFRWRDGDAHDVEIVDYH